MLEKVKGATLALSQTSAINAGAIVEKQKELWETSQFIELLVYGHGITTRAITGTYRRIFFLVENDCLPPRQIRCAGVVRIVQNSKQIRR